MKPDDWLIYGPWCPIKPTDWLIYVTWCPIKPADWLIYVTRVSVPIFQSNSSKGEKMESFDSTSVLLQLCLISFFRLLKKVISRFKTLVGFKHLKIGITMRSLSVEEDEGSYLPNSQTKLVVVTVALVFLNHDSLPLGPIRAFISFY